jgi:hypothetical protein
MRRLKSSATGKTNDASQSSSSKALPTPTSAKLVARSIPDHWNALVPAYESKSYPMLIAKMEWNPLYAAEIELISDRRSANRFANYVDFSELRRAKKKWTTKGEASMRFGVSKTGHGYNGERGDFCLVGGVIRGRDLMLFYRSLELIGGFAYDLTLIRSWEVNFQISLRTVTIIATKANVFALKGNSNEKLFPKLQEIFRG